MSEKNVIKDIFSKLGFFSDSENTNQNPKFSSSEYLEQSRELRLFEARVDNVLADVTKVGGHLFLLDFSGIKANLGDKWTKSRGHIDSQIKSIILKNLSPHELHFKKDDTTYILLLPDLDLLEGQMKSSAIAEDVSQTISGVSAHFNVEVVTMSDEGELVRVNAPSLGHLVNSVIDHLETTSTDGQSDEMDNPRTQGEVSKTNQLLEGITFVYRPLLSAQTKIISTFICIPVRELEAGQLKSGYSVFGKNPKAEEIQALDIACVSKVARELEDLIKTEKRSLLAIPIHVETLQDIIVRAAYIKHCREKFKGRYKRIIFEIIGLPKDLSKARIGEFTSTLKPFCRVVIARISTHHKKLSAVVGTGLHAVGLDLFEGGDDEAQLMKEMDIFVGAARQIKIKCYVEGVHSRSLFMISVTNGFDYICGSALSGIVKNASDIKEFKLEQMYVSILESWKR